MVTLQYVHTVYLEYFVPSASRVLLDVISTLPLELNGKGHHNDLYLAMTLYALLTSNSMMALNQWPKVPNIV